jgi:hypothetical protein
MNRHWRVVEESIQIGPFSIENDPASCDFSDDAASRAASFFSEPTARLIEVDSFDVGYQQERSIQEVEFKQEG